jgi:pSer/pThr/pTyr-binding forkhead associated (FHA) protein
MTEHNLTYAEHVAFYQRQQLLRKRKQFELAGHPAEALTTVQPRATQDVSVASVTPDADDDQTLTAIVTRQTPIAPPVDPTVRLRLRVEAGPNAGAEFALTEGEYVIGRDTDANIRLTDDSVSHRHAKVVVTSRRATIQDLGSLNGSKLGDVSLRGTAILSPGDRIYLAETQLLVDKGDQGE